MKIKLFFFLFFLVFSFLSCATAGKVQDRNQEQAERQPESEPQPVELKKKKSLADDIIVRDIYNKEEYPLSKIAMKSIVFIEISASWCEACPQMRETTSKLVDYFGNRVFFVRLYLENDISEEREYNDVVPEMAIVSSPGELSLEKTEAMPRVVVLSNSASEIAADITGAYPVLYYYGLLSEL
ncbi:hypothetical protein J5690_07335 [bacterium]|nr:hypothetical protein [bacterium]